MLAPIDPLSRRCLHLRADFAPTSQKIVSRFQCLAETRGRTGSVTVAFTHRTRCFRVFIQLIEIQQNCLTTEVGSSVVSCATSITTRPLAFVFLRLIRPYDTDGHSCLPSGN